MRRRLLASLLLGSVMSATVHAQRLTGRVFQSIPLSVDTLLDGSRDSTLARPLLLTVSDSLIVFFDYGESRLRAIDQRGQTRWRAGRRGQGPGEWGNPVALVGVPNGVIVSDGALSRLVEVQADGRVGKSLVLQQSLQRLGRLPNNELVGIGRTNGRPIVALLGRDLQTKRQLPWVGWPDSALGQGAQVRLASSVEGRVVAVSIFTGRIMPLRSPAGFDLGVSSIDPHEMPARTPLTGPNGELVAGVPPTARPAIRDAAIVRDLLFVVPSGDDIGGRVLDIYRLPSARYLASIRLPIEVNVLAADATSLLAVSNEPYPAIVRLRWNRDALERALAPRR